VAFNREVLSGLQGTELTITLVEWSTCSPDNVYGSV